MAITYGDHGLAVLGINLWEAQGTVKKYQNLYPNVLMLKDPGTVWNVYKQGGYIPLNYVLGHDLDQTVDYWMEGFSQTTIESRIKALLPDVSANVMLDAPSFPRGGVLGFDIVATNWIPSAVSVYMLVDIELPSGGFYNLGVVPLNLAPDEVRTIPFDLPIPASVPLGDYAVRVLVGLPPADLWNSDTDDFEITR